MSPIGYDEECDWEGESGNAKTAEIKKHSLNDFEFQKEGATFLKSFVIMMVFEPITKSARVLNNNAATFYGSYLLILLLGYSL